MVTSICGVDTSIYKVITSIYDVDTSIYKVVTSIYDVDTYIYDTSIYAVIINIGKYASTPFIWKMATDVEKTNARI